MPDSESHLRPLLTSLKTDAERVKVWQDAVDDSQDSKVKITAAFVQKKVDDFIASGEVVEDIAFELLKIT